VTAWRDIGQLKAVGSKPRRNRLDFLVGRTKKLAVLLGRQPVVEIRRGLVLLLGHKLVEGSLLRRRVPEHEKHAVHWQAGRRIVPIVFGRCQRMRVAPLAR
jgi:hypothetical protein